MAKVITFSRTFPSYHPRKGEPTFFLEKFWSSIGMKNEEIISQFIWPSDWFDQKHQPKHHTIRLGHRFKVGDWFSPRVWSGKPYKSKQIIISPDIQVKKTWNLEIDEAGVWAIGLPGTQLKYTDDKQDSEIALNDGLSEQDLYWWFKDSKKPLAGQIICWNENIEY